jgi:hypothetical protein
MSHVNRFVACGVLVAAVLVAGCKKEAPPPNLSTAAAPGQEAAPASPAGQVPMPPPPPPAVVRDAGDVNATLAQLSLELRKYVVRTRSVPKSFEEFVLKSRVQVPPPPAGKKYKIQDQAVVLVAQ